MGKAYLIPNGELSGVIFFPPTVRTFRPRVSRWRRLVRICFLLFALVVVWSSVLFAYAPAIMPQTVRAVVEVKPQVTGVLYDADNPLAIVSGKVVRQGEIVDGYLVASIRPDGVELVKAQTAI